MRTIIDNKCLASWAVFRQLSENGRKNRYDVLREFIKASIYKHGLREFGVPDLTDVVNKDYAFTLKNAVIGFAIQAFKFEKVQGNYVCNPNDFADYKQINDDIEKESALSNGVIEQLYAYVEEVRQQTMINREKGELVQSFINYILDNGYSDQNAKDISSFVMKFKQGNTISNPLGDILEGVVSYTGVVFDSASSASSRWTTEMYVYLDTEIIFHMAGYNGELYKQQFDDFYAFVEEINADSKTNTQKKKIHLRYFPETEDEIERFFERAKDIVNNKLRMIPSVTAMKTITEGCTSDADIVEKKGLLLELMKCHGIHRDPNPVEYYREDKYSLNIEDQGVIDKFHTENPNAKVKDIEESLVSLSHVNVLRKGKSDKSFENLRYVLLTDNYITKRLSRMPEIRKDGDRPLSTDLYFITNRMWYRLGKAFGNGETPRVFNVINKARVILSSQVNNSVAAKYEDLLGRMDRNEISSEAAIEVLYQLRNEVKNPEDIDSESDLEKALIAINETDIDRYAEKEAFRRRQEESVREENEQLKRDKAQMETQAGEIAKDNERIKQRNSVVEAKNSQIEEKNLALERKLDDKEREKKALEEQLAEARQKAAEAENTANEMAFAEYCRKKRRSARWNVVLVILFLAMSTVYSWLAAKYQWNFLPIWLQSLAVYSVPQLLVLIRTKVAKIGFWDSFAVAFGGHKKQLKEDFEKNQKGEAK